MYTDLFCIQQVFQSRMDLENALEINKYGISHNVFWLGHHLDHHNLNFTAAANFKSSSTQYSSNSYYVLLYNSYNTFCTMFYI